ncbi:MAG: outer membrane protein assembly factor BamE [Gammaproteobacteria bacterium]|nr:outer membrane protein assembly factor BamE [Gammaproteobacteria bacterium]
MAVLRSIFLFSLILGLSACGSLKPYQMQIQQGNDITPAMIQKLKPGMTKEQVEYVLGSPNLKDPTMPNQWYYVYTNQENHLPMAENKLIITFKNGKLAQIAGDYPPPAGIQYSTYNSP